MERSLLEQQGGEHSATTTNNSSLAEIPLTYTTMLGRGLRTHLRKGRGTLKALPVLRGICERCHDVLLYEEEHWEEEPQPHGTHHRPNGEGLDWGQHKQALGWVVVKFRHWKEEGSDVRMHFLDEPSTRTQIISLFFFFLKPTLQGTNTKKWLWQSGTWEPEDHTIKTGPSSYFRFSSLLKDWPPSWLDSLWLVLGRHYVWNKNGRLIFQRCKAFLD